MFESKKNKSKSATLTTRDLVAVTCFFASGFVGLAYEICWIRKATLVFGTTAFAVSTVVAVFFAGLALGSYIFGRYSQKTLRPLMLYALLELCLGGLALLNPAIFSWAENFYGLFYSSIVHSFALLSFVRFIFVSLLILPPTFLMGASLPLFCRRYVVNERRISLSVGLLYGLNTLGAVFGCIVCGFYLIPRIGVNRTIYLGGILNILIGLTVGLTQITTVSLHKINAKFEGRRRKGSSLVPPPIPSRSTPRNVFIISVLFFLSGFAVLGNEILWTRYLSLIVHNTVYTYTLILAVILAGIVLGSVLICGFIDRTYRRALIFGALHVLTGISVLALLMLPAQWWKGVIDTEDFSTHLWIFILLLLFPAVLSGMSFPLAIRMVVEQPLLAGIGVGKMTAINTVGGIAGSLAMGFVVLPSLGLQKGLLLTTAVSLFIGFAAWLLLERTLRPLLKSLLVAASLCVWVAVPFVTGTRLPLDFLAERDEWVDLREGLSSHLAVIRKNKAIVLEIDRMWQGSNRKSHQIMAAHIPMLLHQSPKDVLVIGLGVGQTARSFLLYDLAQLHCVDIESKLFELIRKHYDSAWMDDERFSFIVEDGRNYLTHTNSKYDVISIEIGQTFRPGLASFYTTDFYRHARNRLNNNGIVSQFVPVPFLDTKEFLSVIRSFLQVFPESMLWYNTSEFLLIGSTSNKLKISSKRLNLLSSDEVISKDLRFAYWGGPAHWLNQRQVFLAGFLCGPETLARLTCHASVYSDDLPLLEYITAKNQTRFPRPIVDLIRPYVDPPQLLLNEKLNDETLSKIQLIRQQNLRDVIANSFCDFVRYARSGYLKGDDVFFLLRKAIQWNPFNVRINIELGNALIRQDNLDEAVTYFTESLRINPESDEAHHNLGYALARQGNLDEAIAHFAEALRINPEFADAHYYLACTLAQQDKLDESITQFTEAIRINPNFANAHYNLGVALTRQDRLDEAIKHFTKALRIKPDFADAQKSLERALLLQNSEDKK